VLYIIVAVIVAWFFPIIIIIFRAVDILLLTIEAIAEEWISERSKCTVREKGEAFSPSSSSSLF